MLNIEHIAHKVKDVFSGNFLITDWKQIDMDGKVLLERIKDLCAKKEISIRQLERETHLADRTIGRWDTNMPSIDRVKKVADYFSVPVDYLLQEQNDYIPDTESEDLYEYLEMVRRQPEIRMLLKTQRGATRKEVEENVAFLKTLKIMKNQGGF